MAEHNELGRRGEQEAMLYLIDKGYTLLDRNWHSSHLEIDIVAEWYGEIVFVEVKTRTNEDYAPAEEAVTLRKKERVIAAARHYLGLHGLTDRPYSYDIITVVGKERPFTIKHLVNAYREQQVWRLRHHRKLPSEV